MAFVSERRNRKGILTGYKVTACLGRDDDNKQIWRACTISLDDPRISERTPVKQMRQVQRLADEWEEEKKAEYQRTHSKEDKDNITFRSFVLEHWWPDHVMDGSHTPSSVSFYKNMSDGILAYFGSRKHLNQIDAEAVKRYIKYLNTQATTKGGNPLSDTTIVRHYQTLRNILNYAIRFGYLKEDPCIRLTVKDKPRKGNKEIDFLSPKDAQRFMLALESEPLYWRCLMNVLITCGLRRGEAVGLQWGDIDTENLTLTVSRNVTIDKDAEDKLHIGSTKTGETRTVPLSPRVYALLRAFKADQEKKYAAALLPTAFIFCSAENAYKPLYPTEPTRWQAKFVKRNDLPRVSPHDLRHTAATLALESGADLKQVQQLLGHKDPTTTMQFYAGVTEEGQRRTVEGIESILAAK